MPEKNDIPQDNTTEADTTGHAYRSGLTPAGEGPEGETTTAPIDTEGHYFKVGLTPAGEGDDTEGHTASYGRSAKPGEYPEGRSASCRF